MKPTTVVRKSLEGIFTTGATLSVGFISFAGMLLISPSLLLGASAFVLAAAYEGQVNGEGIRVALKRMFNPDYLKIGMITKRLNDLFELDKVIQDKKDKQKQLAEKQKEQEEKPNDQKIKNDIARLQRRLNRMQNIPDEFQYANNKFYQTYKSQKQYIQALEDRRRYNEKRRDALLRFFESEARDQLKQQIEQDEKSLKEAKKRLHDMAFFMLNTLFNPPEKGMLDNSLSQAAMELIDKNVGETEAFKSSIKHRARLIRASWIFCIGAGVSAFFATLSQMATSVATTLTAAHGLMATALTAIFPAGSLIALSVIAAIGYTLLMYQSISDMIQEYGSDIGKQFCKREGEWRVAYVARCIAMGAAILLGLFATFATAGTWWTAVKHGATLIGLAEKAASIIRSITVAMLVLPNFVFTAQNSIESIDKITRSNYKKMLTDLGDEIVEAWNQGNVLRFVNPARLLANIIARLAKTILLLGHIFSIGAGTDDVPPGPAASATLSGASELLADVNYLPDEEGDGIKESLWLTALFTPVSIVVFVLKGVATVWDYVFSGFADIKQSAKYMYTTAIDQNEREPALPEESQKIEGFGALRVCDRTIQRLTGKEEAKPKIDATQNIKNKVIQYMASKEEKASLIIDDKDLEPFAKNRNTFWQQPKTRSQQDMEAALKQWRHPKPNALVAAGG